VHRLDARFVEGNGVYDFFKQRDASDSPIRIASPFITMAGIKSIEKHVARSRLVRFLTRASLGDWLAGASDPRAIQWLLTRQKKRRGRIEICVDPSLHAKVYILGNEALVGSANLTESGQSRNLELAVQFQGKGVAALRERFDGWFQDADPVDERKFRENWAEYKNKVREREAFGYLHSMTGYYDALVHVLGHFIVPVSEDKALRTCERPQLLDFLKGWKLIETDSSGFLTVSAVGQEVLSGGEAFAEVILERDASAAKLLRHFATRTDTFPEFTYTDVVAEFPRSRVEEDGYKWGFWGTRIRWFLSVGALVELEDRNGREKRFVVTELGHKLLGRNTTPVTG